MAGRNAGIVLLMISTALCMVTQCAKPRVGADAIRIGKNPGGYVGMVVAISDEVANIITEPDPRKLLVGKIKESFSAIRSALLYATDNQFFLDEVTILIPEHWDQVDVSDTTTKLSYDDAHVRVASPNPLYDDVPYVKPGPGCGQQGQYMHLTPAFLSMNDTARKRRFGEVRKVLAHEFAHLAWGVYEEYPRPGIDPQYYMDSQGDPRPNTCTQNITGDYVRRDNTTCGENKDACIFRPHANTNETASLMGYTHLAAVNQFCDDTTHNAAADTEQNRRCDGRSVMGVVRDLLPLHYARRYTSDTKTEPSRPCPDDTEGNNSTTCFRLLRAIKQRTYTFIRGYDKELKRIDAVFKATVKDVLVEGLSEVDDLLLQTFTYPEYNGQTQENFTTRDLKELLNPSAQVNDSTQGGPMENGKAIPATRQDSQSSDQSNERSLQSAIMCYLAQSNVGAEVYVFIDKTGGEETDNKNENCTEEIKGRKLHIKCIYFKQNSKIGIPCDEEIFVTKNQNKVNVPKKNKKKKSITLQRKKEKGKPVEGKFFRESEQSQNLLITLTTDGGTDSTAKLISVTMTQADPNKTNTIRHTGSTLSDGVFQYTIPVPDHFMSGEVEYNVSYTPAAEKEVEMEVEVEGIPEEGAEPIVAAPVIRTATTMNFSDPDVPVLLVSAEVTKGYFSVVNATVTAHAHFQDEAEEDIPELMTSFPLLDNGVGADGRENDGIYSAYYTGFPTNTTGNITIGGVSITIAVDNADGRAAVNNVSAGGASGAFDILNFYLLPLAPDPEPADRFERFIPEMNYEIVNLPNDGEDLYPPARIVDLRVVDFTDETRHASIHFTATGDDLMQGKASCFELRHAPTQAALRSNFSAGLLVEQEHYIDATDLKEPGERMLLKVDFNYFSDQSEFALAVVIFDDKGQGSEPSNLAYFQFQPKPTTTTRGGPSESTEMPASTDEPSPGPTTDDGGGGRISTMWLIIAVCCSILGVAILIMIIACCCCRKLFDGPGGIGQQDSLYDRIRSSFYQRGPIIAIIGHPPESPTVPEQPPGQHNPLKDSGRYKGTLPDLIETGPPPPLPDKRPALPPKQHIYGNIGAVPQGAHGGFTRAQGDAAAGQRSPAAAQGRVHVVAPNQGAYDKFTRAQGDPAAAQPFPLPGRAPVPAQDQGAYDKFTRAQGDTAAAQLFALPGRAPVPAQDQGAYDKFTRAQGDTAAAQPFPLPCRAPVPAQDQGAYDKFTRAQGFTAAAQPFPVSGISHVPTQDQYPLLERRTPGAGVQKGSKTPPPVPGKPRESVIHKARVNALPTLEENSSTASQVGLQHSSMEDIASRNTLCEQFTETCFDEALDRHDPYNKRPAGRQFEPHDRESGVYHDAIMHTPQATANPTGFSWEIPQDDVVGGISPTGGNWDLHQAPSNVGPPCSLAPHTGPPGSSPSQTGQNYAAPVASRDRQEDQEDNPFARSSLYEQIGADLPPAAETFGGWKDPVKAEMLTRAGAFSYAPVGQMGLFNRQ